MSYLDMAVITAVAAIVVGPYLFTLIPPLPVLWPPQKPQEPDFRGKWVETLIELQTQLEEEGQDNATKLCRSLIWELLGGGPTK